MFLKVLLHQYRYSVSALFMKQYSQILLMFFSVVLNFVLVNSMKEYVPSSDTTGNQVYCLKTKQKSPWHWLVYVLSSAFLFVLLLIVLTLTTALLLCSCALVFNHILMAHQLKKKYILV